MWPRGSPADRDLAPQRIAVVGNGGGGKSTLSRALGARHGLPVHSLDDVQFLPGWRRAPLDDVAREHARWLAANRWIIDGWGDWPLIEERLARADLVVLVDFPLRTHLAWAMKRQVQAVLGRSTHWPPRGCSAWRVTARMVRTLVRVHRSMRPRLLALVEAQRRRAEVVVLRSPRELRAFTPSG